MSKELIVSANRHETRVAVLEDDQVVEVYYQREKEYSLAGSIHKGRVTRVLPGMQSAFVDIGLDRDAFLYVSDFFEDNDEYDKIVTSVEEKILKMEKGPGPGGTPPPPLDAPPSGFPRGDRRVRQNRNQRRREDPQDGKRTGPRGHPAATARRASASRVARARAVRRSACRSGCCGSTGARSAGRPRPVCAPQRRTRSRPPRRPPRAPPPSQGPRLARIQVFRAGAAQRPRPAAARARRSRRSRA